MTIQTYTTRYNMCHELVDYGLCSDGLHHVLLKIGNIEDNRHKDCDMNMRELKALHEIITDFLKGAEE